MRNSQWAVVMLFIVVYYLTSKKLTKHDKVPTSMGTEGSADSLMEKIVQKQFISSFLVQHLFSSIMMTCNVNECLQVLQHVVPTTVVLLSAAFILKLPTLSLASSSLVFSTLWIYFNV